MNFPRPCLFCGRRLAGSSWDYAWCISCGMPALPPKEMASAWPCAKHMRWHPNAKVNEVTRVCP